MTNALANTKLTKQELSFNAAIQQTSIHDIKQELKINSTLICPGGYDHVRVVIPWIEVILAAKNHDTSDMRVATFLINDVGCKFIGWE